MAETTPVVDADSGKKLTAEQRAQHETWVQSADEAMKEAEVKAKAGKLKDGITLLLPLEKQTRNVSVSSRPHFYPSGREKLTRRSRSGTLLFSRL